MTTTSKRSRPASTTCAECYRAKIKCDKQRPCENCVSKHFHCGDRPADRSDKHISAQRYGLSVQFGGSKRPAGSTKRQKLSGRHGGSASILPQPVSTSSSASQTQNSCFLHVAQVQTPAQDSLVQPPTPSSPSDADELRAALSASLSHLARTLSDAPAPSISAVASVLSPPMSSPLLSAAVHEHKNAADVFAGHDLAFEGAVDDSKAFQMQTDDHVIDSPFLRSPHSPLESSSPTSPSSFSLSDDSFSDQSTIASEQQTTPPPTAEQHHEPVTSPTGERLESSRGKSASGPELAFTAVDVHKLTQNAADAQCSLVVCRRCIHMVDGGCSVSVVAASYRSDSCCNHSRAAS